MFVGPHRTWRSSSLNKVSLFGYPMPSYGALLESDNLPHFQYVVPTGMQGMQGAHRDLGSADEAPAFVKTSLARLLDRQQSLVTATWQSNGGQVPLGAVPDLFKPFRVLIETLLPHLTFVGIDDTDPNNILVNFRPVERDHPVFDIDSLSSGEKAAIALLLPLIERQADELVADSVADTQGAAPEADAQVSTHTPLTMLLDEPEIHLHPLLQLQVLQYMRRLASENAAQFILSTHSTTLLDALNDNELYLVSPAALTIENQLSQLTNSQERLELAREITGSTHVLTRAKPIVFMEGEEERAGLASDSRLVATLLPTTAPWATVPGRSRSEVEAAVGRLRHEGIHLPGSPVFGLVDGDSDSTTANEYVFTWPVAMVENFLLDADAIYGALKPFGSQTAAQSVSVVQIALDQAANTRVEDEVRLRVQRALPVLRLALRPNQISDIDAVTDTEVAKWRERVASLNLTELETKARTEVNQIQLNGSTLDRFHGKKIFRDVFGRLRVSQAGVGQSAFALLVANQDAAKDRASKLAIQSIDKIRFFFPASLADTLREAGVYDLANECDAEFQNWLTGASARSSRTALRDRVFAAARGLQEPHRERTATAASQIGTT